MFDLVIRNGIIVDGTGRDRFSADVAVRGGRIVQVGQVGGGGREEIDASGLLVTPGWVDVHTHFDGQATWDPILEPSSVHGTTTVVMGNCGVGFAPCKPTAEERDRMIRVMEDVEDIPGSALHEGITWEWESFPEYLDALDRCERVIDIAAQVPHCAVRCYVMGERGVHNEAATEEDIQRMVEIVREGLAAGALGFSTSRTELHRTRDGDVMPGTYADEAELLRIGAVLGEPGHGLYQVVSDFHDWQREMDWMKRLSLSTGRPVNFVLFYRRDADAARIREQLAYVKQANAEGARLVPHVAGRPVSILMGWEGSANPFMLCPRAGEVLALTGAERVAMLRDPEYRARLLSERPVPTGHELVDALGSDFDNFFVLGDPPDYEQHPSNSVGAIARRAGVSPAQVAYDALLANEGRGMLYYPGFGYGAGDLSAQVEMLKDESTVLSLADGGAHCGVLCDASMPTYVLQHYVRDRTRGERFALEWAVHQMTGRTAQAAGLEDRGTLKPGMLADINVIDFDALRLHAPEVVYDLPAAGRRVVQHADGYRATIKSGVVTFRDGRHTGALPGRLIRGTQPAPAART